VGEGATIGATPAVVNAVLDALAPLGVTEIAIPMTPMRVWRAVERAQHHLGGGCGNRSKPDAVVKARVPESRS